MQTIILRLGLYFIGIAGILIGTSFILLGVNVTGQFFNSVLLVFYDGGPLLGLDNANAESELRFYSVFWIAYSVLLIQAAGNLPRHRARVPWLIGLFFAGGMARLIGCLSAGAPHALFLVLMIIELLLPIILWVCWLSVRKRLR